MPPAAVFFDLDGCLVDSQAAITTAINAALRAAGLPERPPADLTWCIGPPLLGSFERLLGEAGADPARAPALVRAYRADYPDVARRRTRVIAGIPGLLRRLHATTPLAVVTSKPAVFAGPILDATGLAPWFEGLFAPDLDALTEAKATTLLRALESLVPDADPARTVMVGDRRHDIEAGRACGTATVGVTWGAGSREELEQTGARTIVHAPDHLAALLGGVGTSRSPSPADAADLSR